MTRTEAIAQAIRAQLLALQPQINAWEHLRGITFEVKLKPRTTLVRAVIVRPELEAVLTPNGHD